MRSVAIYARYSSVLQNPKSVEDQIKDCKQFIETNSLIEDYQNLLVFYDKAETATVQQNRHGYTSLVEAIKRREISVLVAEGLDRLARNLEHSSHLHKLTRFYGTKLYSLQDGKITSIHIGLRGTMNDMYVENLGYQVRRGQKHRALEGMMTGLAYGYKIKLENGREVKGDRIIDEEIAPIIREIFEMYADGHSLASMVEILNSREIPSPRGGEWRKTALIGSIKRHEGLLCNQLYRGRVIWNQKSKHINPETGGKNYFVNPESEWVITDREDLRIVSEELWTRCDLRKFDRKSVVKKVVPYYTFNPYRQLIFCGACSGHKTLADRKRYVCQSWKAKRTCNNARGTRQSQILEEIQHALQDAIKIKTDKQIRDEIDSVLNVGKHKRDLLLKEVKRLDLCIKQTTYLIGSKGIELEAVTDRLKELQYQHADLQVQLAETTDPPKEGIRSLFLRTIDDLVKALGSPQRNDRYRVLLRILVEKIILTPISHLPYGETIDVVIADNAWVKLHQYLCTSDSKSQKT